MIVPAYWAEASVCVKAKRRKMTVRRFGWSDLNQQDAQANAEARASEALQRIQSGEKLLRREPKVAYNGAEGVPIREEIIGRHRDVVITRNLYGARCLNTPNVLFADIDFPVKTQFARTLVWFAIHVLMLVAGWWALRSFERSGPGVFLAIVVPQILLVIVRKLVFKPAAPAYDDMEKSTLLRLRDFVQAHPQWNLRAYRTPAGIRVLVMHRVFDPGEPEVAECFNAWGVDPLYAKMCTRQKCFRARVSAKPWRIGIAKHIRPQPGIWPVKPEQIPLRKAWVEEYEKVAQGYGACRFLEAIGNGQLVPETYAVQTIHDELCRATRAVPLG